MGFFGDALRGITGASAGLGQGPIAGAMMGTGRLQPSRSGGGGGMFGLIQQAMQKLRPNANMMTNSPRRGGFMGGGFGGGGFWGGGRDPFAGGPIQTPWGQGGFADWFQNIGNQINDQPRPRPSWQTQVQPPVSTPQLPESPYKQKRTAFDDITMRKMVEGGRSPIRFGAPISLAPQSDPRPTSPLVNPRMPFGGFGGVQWPPKVPGRGIL